MNQLRMSLFHSVCFTNCEIVASPSSSILPNLYYPITFLCVISNQPMLPQTLHKTHLLSCHFCFLKLFLEKEKIIYNLISEHVWTLSKMSIKQIMWFANLPNSYFILYRTWKTCQKEKRVIQLVNSSQFKSQHLWRYGSAFGYSSFQVASFSEKALHI